MDYWLYGIAKVSGALGNTRSLLRAIQEEAIQKLMETEDLSSPSDADPVEVLRVYNRHLDGRGILDADDLAYHRKENDLTVTVGASCPYRGTCNWLEHDHEPIPCFRAIAMGELLRLAAHRAYDGKLRHFGVPCQLTFKRVNLEDTHDGD